MLSLPSQDCPLQLNPPLCLIARDCVLQQNRTFKHQRNGEIIFFSSCTPTSSLLPSTQESSFLASKKSSDNQSFLENMQHLFISCLFRYNVVPFTISIKIILTNATALQSKNFFFAHHWDFLYNTKSTFRGAFFNLIYCTDFLCSIYLFEQPISCFWECHPGPRVHHNFFKKIQSQTGANSDKLHFGLLL